LANRLKQVGFSFDFDELIYKHTLYPFYAPFIFKNSRKVYDRMCTDAKGSIHNISGLMAGSLPMLKKFKYCFECNIHALDTYGELYINRLHQLECIHICPIHELPLIESNIHVSQYNRHEFVYPENIFNYGISEKVNERYHKLLIKIAKIIKELFENPVDSDIDFRAKYYTLLNDKGLLKGRLKVDNPALVNDFKLFYDNQFLSLHHSKITEYNCWLIDIVRKHRKSFHPIRHILMIIYLCGDLGDFLATQPYLFDTPEKPPNSFSHNEEYYKESWLNLQKKYPDKSKTGLRRISPKIYIWLYRHERDWLSNNSPPLQISKSPRERDWKILDQTILHKTKKAVNDILKQEKPYKRVSISRIGKIIGQLTVLEKHLDKLPKTMQYLCGKLETVEQFQKRRIKAVLNLLVEHGGLINESKLYKKAAILKGRSAAIDNFIKEKLDKINELPENLEDFKEL